MHRQFLSTTAACTRLQPLGMIVYVCQWRRKMIWTRGPGGWVSEQPFWHLTSNYCNYHTYIMYTILSVDFLMNGTGCQWGIKKINSWFMALRFTMYIKGFEDDSLASLIFSIHAIEWIELDSLSKYMIIFWLQNCWAVFGSGTNVGLSPRRNFWELDLKICKILGFLSTRLPTVACGWLRQVKHH